MSEYQYYEFAAIDEPLTDKQMQELRAISSRAEITPTSFVNEYNFGDFKGDPRKLIVSHFDAFLHYANWGTLWCMFRLPKAAVDLAAMKRFVTPEAIKVEAKGKCVIVNICLRDEPGNYETPYEQTLAPLIQARGELLEGNLGPLYVAWLAAVQRYIVASDDLEPCDTSQLPPLAAGTRAVADFLMLRDDLLKVGYQAVSKKRPADKPGEMAKWVKSLPDKDKNDYLSRLLTEPANLVRTQLLKQFRARRKDVMATAATTPPRTAGELRKAVGIDEFQ